MLIVNSDNSIELTRGDTARLAVNLEQEDGRDYEMQPGDVLTLSLKKSVKDTVIVMQKVITGGNVFYIQPEDTAMLEFAKYKYDVQLTTEAGEVYTVITPAVFKITAEVTT